MSYTLITGASSGIGALSAIELSKTRKLILSGSNLDKLNEVKQKCNNSDNHIIWQCDFTNQRDFIFSSLVDIIKNNNINIQDYIHFAGMTQILPIKNFTIPYVDKIFNVNFFSIIEIIRVLLRKNNISSMKNIILISALFSIRGDKGNSVYAASKGAINSFVISLAQELAPSIRVNSILPGAIMTPMAEKSNPEHIAMLRDDTPLGLGNPSDIINYVDFLLSDKARWITGQNIIIDGGRSTK